jgi:hypothetical protein
LQEGAQSGWKSRPVALGKVVVSLLYPCGLAVELLGGGQAGNEVDLSAPLENEIVLIGARATELPSEAKITKFVHSASDCVQPLDSEPTCRLRVVFTPAAAPANSDLSVSVRRNTPGQ